MAFLRNTVRYPFRPPRFPVRVDVRYRALGETAWHEGHTENISRGGVLFVGTYPLPPGAHLELVLSLPPAMGEVSVARVSCSGRVLRLQSDAGLRQNSIAAVLSDFNFERVLGKKR